VTPTETPITFPDVGRRVWTVHGLQDHGPIDGPKTSVPANTGGVIVDATSADPGMDNLLYTVKWDTGQYTKHYFRELLCIGEFQTLADFKQALRDGGESAKRTLGPQGGFREFSMSIRHGNRLLPVRYISGQKAIYEAFLLPLLNEIGLKVDDIKLEKRSRAN
jgi:hypothetical protein